VKGDDDVIETEKRTLRIRRLGLEDIERRAGDPASLQRLDQRGLVDERARPALTSTALGFMRARAVASVMR